jgi:hypothetical protein
VRHSRLLTALSIPLGFVLGHIVAYTVAPPTSSPSEQVAHGYFESLAGSAVPLVLAAVLISVVQGRRRGSFGLRASALVSPMIVVYVAVEVFEHLALGVSPVEILSERTLVIGVLVQVVVGLLLHRVLQAGHRLGERLACEAEDFTTYSSEIVIHALAVVGSSFPRASIRLRGPPLGALAHLT